jgi:hypothetical protein
VDENYIRDSILYPNKQVVRGFQPVMPSFLGSLKDRQIDWMIAYLKSVSSHYQGGGGAQAAPPGPAGGGAQPPERAPTPTQPAVAPEKKAKAVQ